MEHKMLLYGTLKSDQPNHHKMTDDPSAGETRLLYRARSVDKWPLVVANVMNAPYLLYKKGTGKHIYGEVYQGDDKWLSTADHVEGHPFYYVRDKIKVQKIISEQDGRLGEEEEVWVYFLKDYKPELLTNDFLEEYQSNADKPLKVLGSRDAFIETRFNVLRSASQNSQENEGSR